MLRVFGEEPTLRTSLNRAVAATQRHLGDEPDYLCCGEAGRIWFLSQAGLRHKELTLYRPPGRRAQMIEKFREQGSWLLQGVRDRNIIPGLMGGTAGLGLAFLDLREPGSVSQVLTLQ